MHRTPERWWNFVGRRQRRHRGHPPITVSEIVVVPEGQSTGDPRACFGSRCLSREDYDKSAKEDSLWVAQPQST